MVKILHFMVSIINKLHDYLVILLRKHGFILTDKEMHFWIIGVCGILLFLFVDVVFKRIAKWNISMISFIYTFTFIVGLTLAIEIEQGITNRGSMEFNDFISGLYGFIAILVVYILVKFIIKQIVRFISKTSKHNRNV